MANQEHLDILKQGVTTWNQWRKEHEDIRADLSKADLSRVDLRGYDLSGANLIKTNLSETYVNASRGRTSFKGADLRNANLWGADLRGTDFTEANLSEADLREANLNGADLRNANLWGADLRSAILNIAHLEGADLSLCSIWGISAWDVHLEGAIQSGLEITPPQQPIITVDNLKVAQFIYLLLNNKEIRDVIDTITSKVVLILGRFADERKKVLDVIRDELRKRNYSPVLFDFEKPANRDITETVSTLAHLARFVIADITEAKSIPQELSQIVPFLPSVPIVPLLQVSEREYGMYEHFISYPWVQPIYHYRDLDELLHSIQEHVIDPAEKKVRELAIEKAKRLERP